MTFFISHRLGAENFVCKAVNSIPSRDIFMVIKSCFEEIAEVMGSDYQEYDH